MDSSNFIRWEIQDGFYTQTHFYHNDLLPDIQVTWYPAGKPFLRYQRLYRGIYEFLRQTPENSRRSQALRYLRSLKTGFNPIHGSMLQQHRIMWTEAWLDELGDVDSDADTIVCEGDDW